MLYFVGWLRVYVCSATGIVKIFWLLTYNTLCHYHIIIIWYMRGFQIKRSYYRMSNNSTLTLVPMPWGFALNKLSHWLGTIFFCILLLRRNDHEEIIIPITTIRHTWRRSSFCCWGNLTFNRRFVSGPTDETVNFII